MRNGGSNNAAKTRRLSKEEIKKQLVDPVINNEKVETEGLSEQADKVQNSEDATTVIKEYEDIIRNNEKKIACIAYHQGKVFRRFKEKEKFMEPVKQSLIQQ